MVIGEKQPVCENTIFVIAVLARDLDTTPIELRLGFIESKPTECKIYVYVKVYVGYRAIIFVR